MNQDDSEPDQTKLTRGQRLAREARQEAERLAQSFDLAECLHLDAFGFDPSWDKLKLSFLPKNRRGETPEASIDDLTEAIRDWIREAWPAQIQQQKLDEYLEQIEEEPQP